jgi:hypothetical protein
LRERSQPATCGQGLERGSFLNKVGHQSALSTVEFFARFKKPHYPSHTMQ